MSNVHGARQMARDSDMRDFKCIACITIKTALTTQKQSPVCFCWRSNGFCKVLALVAFCKKADAKILQFSQGFMKRCCHMKLHVIPPANWNTHRARIQELPGSCGKNHRVDPKMIGSSKNLSQTVAWCNLVDDQKWTFKIWELLRCKSDHKSAEILPRTFDGKTRIDQITSRLKHQETSVATFWGPTGGSTLTESRSKFSNTSYQSKLLWRHVFRW